MFLDSVSYPAVFIASIIYVAIGFIWYHPSCFGAIYSKEWNTSTKDWSSNCMIKAYATTFVVDLLICWGLANLLNLTRPFELIEAVQVGFFAWIAFLAPVMLLGVAWCKKSVKAFLIDALFNLVAVTVATGVIHSWS